MVQRLRVLSDTLSANFFVLPAVAVILAFWLGRVAVGFDAGAWVGEATVDSARAVLSTVAAATITFAAISFSVSLLIIQQGSSQFSPRVIHGLTRDPFNRRVIAFVLATFTYCLVVLQRVRGPLEDGGDEVVPSSAVALGVVAGIAAVLAVVGAIHHTSRKMYISEILGGIVNDALDATRADIGELRPIDPISPPDELASTVVRFAADGWIREVDRPAILSVAAPGGFVRLETDTGRYAIRSTPICTIWPAVPVGDLDDVMHRARAAVTTGPTRTMSEDGGYGVRQLVDIALRALSPGINDPTTAQDAILHLGTVLVARLSEPPMPTAYEDDDGRCLLAPQAMSDIELAELAMTELRAIAAGNPTVCGYLFELLGDVIDAARSAGAGEERVAPFAEQARLLRHAAGTVLGLDQDRVAVQRSYAARFGP